MKEVWCSQKNSENLGDSRWRGSFCNKCCVFCEKRESCQFTTCYCTRKEEFCAWRRSPLEWTMERINPEVKMIFYQLRRAELYIGKGYKEGDGTWEGDFLKRIRKKFPWLIEET